MVDLVKQDMSYLWAQTGDIVPPDNTKIESGWAVESVPRQWWNWMQNRVDTNLAYALQKGIPEWDSVTEYIINKSYVQHLGVVYKCIQTGVNQTPGAAPLYWVKALVESTAAMEALKNLTPAADRLPYFTGSTSAAITTLTAFARTILDDTSAVAVRTTISAQESNTNLTALSGVTAATNMLPYFTSNLAMGTTTLSAFGRTLIDDADAAGARTTLGLGNMALQNSNTVAITGGSISGITDLAIADGGTGSSTAAGARTNLGLGSAALSTVTTSQYDTTAGRLLKVGDYGIGAPSGLLSGVDLDTLTTPGATYTVSTTVNSPTSATGILVVLASFISGRVQQIFYESSAANAPLNRAWIRSSNTGAAWSSWARLWTSDDILNIGTTAASARTALGLDSSSTVATLPLTGGSMSGHIVFSNNIGLRTSAGQTYLRSNGTITVLSSDNDLMIFRPNGDASSTNQAQLTTAGIFEAPFFSGNGASITALNASNLSTGTVAVARGGTGATATTGSGSNVLNTSPALAGTPTAPTASNGTNNTQIATTAFVLANSAGIPAGAVVAFAGAGLPAGYIRCQGGTVSRTTYSDLFTAIGTTYGSGDGSTTFGIPDLRGEFIRGLDAGRGADSGRVLGSAQSHQMQSHGHTFTGTAYGGHTHTGTTASDAHTHTWSGTTSSAGAHVHGTTGATGTGGVANFAYQTGNTTALNTGSAGAHTHTVSGTTSSDSHTHTFTTATGGAFTPAGSISLAGGTTNSNETRPRNVAMNYLIKF